MSQCIRVTNNGNVKISTDLEGFCTEFVVVTQNELNVLSSNSGGATFEITSAEIGGAITWGFGVVVVIGYFSGYVIGVAKSVIRKI